MRDWARKRYIKKGIIYQKNAYAKDTYVHNFFIDVIRP